jgi:hypothetical protein
LCQVHRSCEFKRILSDIWFGWCEILTGNWLDVTQIGGFLCGFSPSLGRLLEQWSSPSNADFFTTCADPSGIFKVRSSQSWENRRKSVKSMPCVET